MNTCREVEKRHHARISEAIHIRLLFPGDSTVYGGHPKDLSPNGARILFPHDVHVNTRLHVHIELPKKEIRCEGQVCWVESHDDGHCLFGVRFMEMDQYDREYLDHCIGRAVIV